MIQLNFFLSKETMPIKKSKSSKIEVAEGSSNGNLDSEDMIFDSRKEGIKLFNKIISPIKQNNFFKY